MKIHKLIMLVGFFYSVTLTSGAGEAAAGFKLKLVPGPYYSKDMTAMLFFKYTVQPQVAVWLETTDGKYIATIYVTSAVVKKEYRAAPKEGRPETLPVWSALKKESADAVSAATVKEGAVEYESAGKSLPAGTYIIKLETNRSYDWNSTYTKKNSGVNGQPSVIYQAELTVGKGRQEAVFKPLGTGSVDGSDGKIKPGLDGIDTALELFSEMKIEYLP
jgi:hypothetical protein